jgi:hypothetical protein
VQGKGLVVSEICECFIEEFVEDARYVQIRIHADRRTDGRTDRQAWCCTGSIEVAAVAMKNWN